MALIDVSPWLTGDTVQQWTTELKRRETRRARQAADEERKAARAPKPKKPEYVIDTSLISSGDLGPVVPPSQQELTSDEFFPSIQHSSDDAYLVESGEHVITNQSGEIPQNNTNNAWSKPLTNRLDFTAPNNEEMFPGLAPGHVVLRRGDPSLTGPSFANVLKAPQQTKPRSNSNNSNSSNNKKKKNNKTVLVLGGGR